MLKDGTFSSGERTLIEIAASLFSQEVKVNLWETFNRLDDRSKKLAVTAICNFARLGALENPFTRSATGKPKHKSRER